MRFLFAAMVQTSMAAAPVEAGAREERMMGVDDVAECVKAAALGMGPNAAIEQLVLRNVLPVFAPP